MCADVTEVRTDLRWPRRTSGWRVAGRETVIGLSGKGKEAALPMLSCRCQHAKVISILSRLGALTFKSSSNAHNSNREAAVASHASAAKLLYVLQACQQLSNAEVHTGVLQIDFADNPTACFTSLAATWWHDLYWQGVHLLHQGHLCFSLSKCLDLLGHSSQLLCIEQHVAGP